MTDEEHVGQAPREKSDLRPGDLDDLPEILGRDWMRSQSVGRIRRLSDNRDRLTPAQRGSLDDSLRAMTVEVLGPAQEQLLRTVRETPDRKGVETALMATMSDTRRRMIDNAQLAVNLDRHSDLQQSIERIAKLADQSVHPTSIPSKEELGTPAVSQALPPSSARADPEDKTVGEVADDITKGTEVLRTLETISQHLLRQNNRIEDEKYLAAILAVAFIAAGVAPIVLTDSWYQRIWIVALTVVISLAAWGGYRYRRHRRESRQDAGPTL